MRYTTVALLALGLLTGNALTAPTPQPGGGVNAFGGGGQNGGGKQDKQNAQGNQDQNNNNNNQDQNNQDQNNQDQNNQDQNNQDQNNNNNNNGDQNNQNNNNDNEQGGGADAAEFEGLACTNGSGSGSCQADGQCDVNGEVAFIEGQCGQ
ncbi:hypothetical protein LX36DRAFT_43397 [Colletotrichum falcatum]|nr:hypothetical protein LX36DRAFT_43397 [Colletotrichum falcatum]